MLLAYLAPLACPFGCACMYVCGWDSVGADRNPRFNWNGLPNTVLALLMLAVYCTGVVWEEYLGKIWRSVTCRGSSEVAPDDAATQAEDSAVT